jgi:uncharacterized protein YlxW (UPF0749 family)
MYQAHAKELLNQKDEAQSSGMASSSHPLYTATERLVAALDRLERNMKTVTAARPPRDPRQNEQMALFQRENESLKTERENLNTAISQLQHQYDDLQQVATTIYGKLNDSIKRLNHIVEN